MKKVFLLSVYFIAVNLYSSFSQNSFTIMVSKPYYLYLEDQRSMNYTDRFSKFPTCYKLNLHLNKHYFALNGKLVHQSNLLGSTLNKGDISVRLMFNIEFCYGRIFQKKKFQIIPFGTVGYRAGRDDIMLSPNPVHIYSQVFHYYDRPYLGMGVHLKYDVNKLITIGIETGYNHYFEPKFQEESKRYNYGFKVNRNSLNLDFNLGFRINWKRSTK